MRQLPLDIALADSARFDNFIVGGNAVAVGLCQAASQLKGDAQVYLWGAPSAGKSHLLQAACAAHRQHAAMYLPMAELLPYGAEILDGMAGVSLVCIDDVHCCAGLPEWERGLFNLINECRAANTHLLLSGHTVVQDLGIELQDLQSRLSWGAVVQLEELDDEARHQWLKQMARQRGLNMSAEVAHYILRHSPRDMHSLVQLFETLDKLSLAEQRKLSIALVKSAILS